MLRPEDVDNQLYLLALAIIDNKPNSLHNWAVDHIQLRRGYSDKGTTEGR